MRCKKAEKYISLSFDGRLGKKETAALDFHLKECPDCRRIKEEYGAMLSQMRSREFLSPSPYFLSRLKNRLIHLPGPEALWKKWALRAVPVSLMAILLLAAGIVFISPAPQTELSRSEILLHNQNPFEETRPVLEEELGPETANMRIIFTAWNENPELRRPRP